MQTDENSKEVFNANFVKFKGILKKTNEQIATDLEIDVSLVDNFTLNESSESTEVLTLLHLKYGASANWFFGGQYPLFLFKTDLVPMETYLTEVFINESMESYHKRLELIQLMEIKEVSNFILSQLYVIKTTFHKEIVVHFANRSTYEERAKMIMKEAS